MTRARPEDGIAWVTGASAGIGRALSLRLAREGWRVAVTARRQAELEALAAAAPGGRIVAFAGDVTDAPGMDAMVATIEREMGPIALAVLNAGAYDLSERDGFRRERVMRAAAVNFGGPVNCLDPLLPAMIARGRGQIAIVASLAGYGGVPGSLAYGSSKAAAIAMAEALRLTYADAGLTIQVVNPGFVATAMTAPNDYPMPFMMSADDAAARICAGLARGGFEIAFPRRLVWPMKLAGLLPYPLWLRVMALATRRVRASTSA
jgi:NAD(P)-dependent dehydrogenase (short-subunit alcohol dehydrogenase family)